MFKMREKNEHYQRIPLSLGVCLLLVLVFCILPVQVGHWSASGPNGQYDVTYTSHGDGSATLQGAGVGPGGSIEQLGSSGSGGSFWKFWWIEDLALHRT